MSDQVVTVTVKGVGDFNDVVHNVNSVQKALTKLKLPDKIGDSLNKNITSFYKEYEKYQAKIANGLKTQGDYNQVEKSLNTMRNLYQAIGQDAQKLTQLDMEDLLKLDVGEFKKITDDITNVIKQIGSVKVDSGPFTKAIEEIRGITKNSKISGENGLLNQIFGSINSGQLAEAKKQLQELKEYAERVKPRQTAEGKQMPGTLKPENFKVLATAIGTMEAELRKAEAATNPLIEKQDKLQRELEETKQKAAHGIKEEFQSFNEASKGVDRVTDSLIKMHREEFDFNRQAMEIDRQIQSYFGLSQMIRKVGDIARDAFATVKDLDKAMTETAVVTNFSVGDMWEMLPTYTAQANQLGSSIRDVYEAATLYYQQGLNTNQAMGLANETLKMARIAGLDAAEATNMMTAALRGFNMEVNQQSAQKINDIYSELAAITASDTAEIGSAMERTASIANSANMDFATTSAFLAQMIETTREAPENLGTAMKTIVARFQEMKQDPTKLVDSEGIAMDVNKVDKALKTIGVNLTNQKGEFRDLDDVFLDISQRWDSLTQGQQRYIATIAAGSRQQSRFIAMMSNYERTMELVDAANNSAGASQRQFEKTLDSMEAKLNKLKNAWDQFTMGLMNNQILKFGVDALTEGFTIVNKFIDAIGKISPKPFEGITKSVLTLVTTLGMLNFGKKATRGLVTGGAGWWKGETSLIGGFKEGWKSTGQTGFFANRKNNQAEQQGIEDGQAYGRGWSKAVQMLQNKRENGQSILSQALGIEQFKKNRAMFGSDTAMVNSLFPKGGLDDEARRDAQDYLNKLRQELSEGKITKEQLPTLIESGLGRTKGFSDENIESVAKGLSDKKIKAIGIGFTGLTTQINSAGVALSNFGAILQGTPLEPFGQILSTVGGALISLSTVLATAKAGFLEQWAAATIAAVGEETEAGAALSAAAANGTLTASSIAAAGGMATLATAIGAVLIPLLAIAAIVAVVVGAYKLLDAAIETNKEKMEAAADAAAAASEAYDSAKQETSELADSIEQIKETDSAFDNLVAGTAEFNEQLVNANEQITELINKYPMLMEGGYVTTDKNGLMHVSTEGLEEVEKYQKRIQNNASAMNLIQTADLSALEKQQKAGDLRRKANTSSYSLGQYGPVETETREKERKKTLQEADLLEQRAKAEVDLARKNAIRTALSSQEFTNTEALTGLYADLYEEKRKAAEIEVEGLGKHEVRQKYADYHGYTYDRSTKKIKDVEGNEVNYDDKAIEDEVIEQTVVLNFEENASSLDDVLTAVDNQFKQGLSGDFGNASGFISDVLSNNIDTNQDLIEQMLNNPEELSKFADTLTEKQIATILGVSEKAVSADLETYQNQFEDKVISNAKNIIEANADANGKVAAMLAQAQGKTIEEVTSDTGIQDDLIKQVQDLTSEQRNTLLCVGEILESSVGGEAMATFVDGMSNIYKSSNEQLKTVAQDWSDGINWESSIDRLRGYNEAINITKDEVKGLGEEGAKQMNELGRAMMDSQDEANLLGEAFSDFYNSSDWEEVSKNMDKFVDSTGQLNASSVMDMAKECNTLNNLLDTGAISAGGVAAALNGLGSSGGLVLDDLNSHVLELLSTFNQFNDLIASSHRNIENFDWGIDTGEAEDFVKEGAEKWNELYKNGEYGNPQLEAYAKWVMGEQNYNEVLADKGGNLQETMKAVYDSVNLYADGFDKAWAKLAGGELGDVKLSDELSNLGIKVGYENDGTFNFDPGKATTEQLQKYLEEVFKIGPEMAQAMLEDFSNYSGDFRAERQHNDFMAGLDSYVANRTSNGEVAITSSELQSIAAATGKSEEEISKAIEEASGKQIKELENIDKNTGEYIMDGAELNKQFSEAEGLKTQNGWLAQYKQADTGDKGIDLDAAMAAAVERGYTTAQAQQMAFTAYKEAAEQGKDYYYKDQKIEAGAFKTADEFIQHLAELDQNEQWVTAGEIMADAWIAKIEGYENKQTTEGNTAGSDAQSTTSTDTSNKPKTKDGTTIPGVGYVSSKDDRSLSQKFNDWVEKQEQNRTNALNAANDPNAQNWEKNLGSGLKKIFIDQPLAEAQARAEQNKEASGKSGEELQAENKEFWHSLFQESDRAADARTQKMTAGIQQTQEEKQTTTDAGTRAETPTSSETDGAVQALNTTVEGLNNSSTNLTTAGETLNTAGQNLTSAAAILATIQPQQNGGGASTPTQPSAPAGMPSNVPQPQQQSSISGAIVVDNSAALKALDELKTKAEETKGIIDKGATFNVKTTGTKSLNKAAKSAGAISKVASAGEQNISLKASTSGTDSKTIDTLKKSISSFEKLKKSHTVKLKTNLTGDSASSINTMVSAINAFHLKTDHTVNLVTNKITRTRKDDAVGEHNHGYAPAPPKAGSAARGSYGQVGPKGKGGMTLTGELGYEIAWIPSENRSMILGANGPQMVDLPGDAVVWTHEQSKKIMKQKSIPAGSHAGRPRSDKPSGGGGGGGSTDKKTPKKDKNKGKGKGKGNDTKKAVKQITGKISVWWENISRKIDATQRRIDKSAKEFEKLTKRYGTTVNSINSVVKSYKKELNKTITLNKEVVKKYNKDLNKLDGDGKQAKTTIKYSKRVKNKKGKITNKDTKAGIYLSDYIDYIDGAWQVNNKKLSKMASNSKQGKNMAKAIKEAAEKYLNDKISRRDAALDKIDKAEEDLEKLNDTIYETFYSWRESITNIYVLTKQLELISSRKDIFSSAIETELSKLAAGFGTAAGSMEDMQKFIEGEAVSMVQSLQTVQAKQKAAVADLEQEWSGERIFSILKKNPDSPTAQDDSRAYLDVISFLRGQGMMSLGTFDYSKAIEALYNRPDSSGKTTSRVNKTTDEKMKQVLDELLQAQNDYFDVIKEGISSANEYYQKIEDYQGIIQEFEDTLISGLEEEMEAEVNELQEIDASLTEAMKDLLDGVKKKLDERRQKEDNLKTETELSQKQQRLAMLRADTAGGHAVEIAQLEKEIADSRQDYQRSLEDQLLEKLQDQADVASEQRQRQIELLEANAEVIKSTDNHAAEIRALLLHPTTNYDKLLAIYRKSQDYDNKGSEGQKQIDEDFEKWLAEYGMAKHGYDVLTQMDPTKLPESVAKAMGNETLVEKVIGIHDMFKQLITSGNVGMTQKEVNLISREEFLKRGLKENFNLKELGVPVEELVTSLNATVKELKEAGYSLSDMKKVISFDEAKGNFSTAEMIKAYGGEQKYLDDLMKLKGVKGKTVQKAKGTSANALQKAINSSKGSLDQKEMAGVKAGKIDTNGKKKGGKKEAVLNEKGTKAITRSGSTLYTQDWDEKTGKLRGAVTTTKVTSNNFAGLVKDNTAQAKSAIIYAIQHQKPGSKINKDMKQIVKQLGIAGETYKLKNGIVGSVGSNGKIYYNSGKKGVYIWDTINGKLTLDKYNKKEFKKKANKNDNVGREYAQVLKKNGVKKYATGGLADYTGPAWLDGTPSKPELVLNAQDTKNFMTLKDVLSKAVGSTSQIENSYGGNATYEININVDHISNDYDVDRVVKKVKKEIVEGSGYRNVTQVRKFR